MRHRRRLLGLVAFGALTAQAGAQMMLVGSWFDSSVKLLDATPGQQNVFLPDFVPDGTGRLSTPDGLAWGSDRNLYVSSSDTGQVLRFHARTGEFAGIFVNTGGGSSPGNLQFGPDGLLYVCLKTLNRVDRYDPETGARVDTFIQGPELATPVGLEWRKGVLYVSDFRNPGGLLRYDAISGQFLGTLAVSNGPLIVRVGPDDNLWLTAHFTSDVSVIDPDTGDVLRRIDQAPINCPVGHVLAPDGSTLVASWGSNRVLRYDTDTGVLIEIVAFDLGELRLPNDIIFMIDPCLADLTNSANPNDDEYGLPNGVIDSEDFFYFLDQFASDGSEADIDGDGDADADDFFAYLDLFAAGCD